MVINKVPSKTPLLPGQTIDYFGAKLVISARSVGYYGSFLNGEPYEYDVLQRFMNDIPVNGIVLDIGACTGSYAMLDLIRPDIQIHSFEPSRSYDELTENIKMNGSKTKCYRTAISDRSGVFDFNEIIADQPIALSMLGGTPADHKHYRTYKINTMTIDEIDIKPNIIKIDTEGLELMVLRGGQKTINEMHPVIYCEYCDENTSQYGYSMTEISKLLISWGYTVEVNGGNLIAKWIS